VAGHVVLVGVRRQRNTIRKVDSIPFIPPPVPHIVSYFQQVWLDGMNVLIILKVEAHPDVGRWLGFV